MKTSLQIAEDAAWRRVDIMDTSRAIDELVADAVKTTMREVSVLIDIYFAIGAEHMGVERWNAEVMRRLPEVPEQFRAKPS